MGFDIGLEEERIVLVDEQGGQEHRLAHIVRRPTPSEYMQYQRKITEVRGGPRKVKWEDRRAETALWLYGKIVQKVEGYTFKGKPLQEISQEELKDLGAKWDTPVNSYIDLIPPQHKLQIIDRLVGTFASIAEEMEVELGESFEK